MPAFLNQKMAAAGAQQLITDDGRPMAGSHPLEAFFGPLPPGMMPTQASDAYPHESWALPFAYQGRNIFLASILGKCATSATPSTKPNASRI